MNSAESQLEMGHKIQRSDATSVMRPVGSESKREPNTTTASQAESRLAAEKRTLEMMANGPLFRGPERFVCLHGCSRLPLISMICLRDGEWLSPEAIPPDIETHWIEVCACALETNRMNGSGEC